MYEFNTWRDPYDEGFSTCSKRKVELKEGLTVLVGCNGAGKTTLIDNIKACLRKDDIPCYSFNNLSDGGTNASGLAIMQGDIAFGATAWCSSEGENISLNVGRVFYNIGHFLKTGETPKSREQKMFKQMFSDNKFEPEKDVCNKRFIIMDAVDSGYSIDNVIDLKDVFRLILEDAAKAGLETYIIVSANEYELAAGEQCLDVTNGTYLTFDSYESFKKFILKSRKKKDARIERVNKRNER